MAYQTNVDSLLKSISSTKIKQDIDASYEGVSDAMKEVGSPSNNMLLTVIHGETKRTADEILKLNARMLSIEDRLKSVSIGVSRLCDLMETQNEILASNALNQDTVSTEMRKSSQVSEWFYQGTRLSSRYHVYACIVLHLIDIIQLHLDHESKHYPDSVDCDFKSMQNAVRVVSTERCSISSVEYKNTIGTKEKDSQPFNLLYPHIASSNKASPTTLSESMLGHICNPVTRNVMQDLEWIRQRLCHLDGILSVKQMDILKSIGTPLIKPGTADELNWDPSIVRARSSHPLTRDISDLTKAKKDAYIIARMQGKKLEAAYNIASVFVSDKSK